MASQLGDGRTVIMGGHVIDPSQGIDGVANVAIRDGRIESVGAVDPAPGDEVVDAAGLHVSPGFVDLHVHAYGTLGFADPDSIGIYHGVTTFVEAGGPGVGTLEEFEALMKGRLVTDLYIGAYLRPLGLIGVNYIEGNARSLMDVPIERWMDMADRYRDELRYLKVIAFGNFGTGPLRIGKGLAELIGVPLYVHLGEFQQTPPRVTTADAFRLAEAGDIMTHIYHGNPGGTLDGDGRVLAEVRDAERRGVLFDIGFGAYNFSWRVAERAFAQDLVPHVISSDLQQYNVLGPAYSLAHVMSVFLRLGLGLREVIERVTIAPARALGLDDRAGTLAPGMPADVTVFRVENREVALTDCHKVTRTGEHAIVPVMAFKRGTRYDCDMTRCQDESNWFWRISEDAVPEAAAALDARQREFLAALADALEAVDWKIDSAETLDVFQAERLQGLFHAVRAEADLPLRDALHAVYDSFIANPFTMQMGLFLFRLDKPFALARLRAVASVREAAA